MKKNVKGAGTTHAIFSFCDIASAIAKYVGEDISDQFLTSNFKSLFRSEKKMNYLLRIITETLQDNLKDTYSPFETSYSVFRTVNSIIAAMEYPEKPVVVNKDNINKISKQAFPWVTGLFEKKQISVGDITFEAFAMQTKTLTYIVPNGVDYSFAILNKDVKLN